jgi:hypothetical protein
MLKTEYLKNIFVQFNHCRGGGHESLVYLRVCPAAEEFGWIREWLQEELHPQGIFFTRHLQ